MFILFCMRGCGCIERPAFPAPSDVQQGRIFMANLGRMRRETAKLCSLLFEN
jgi:hypothetical protein